MPEDLPAPIGDDIDDALLRLSPATAEEYGRLKREYKETCRDVRKRHRGVVREKLLRHHAEEFQKKVRVLVDGALGQAE